MMNSLVNSKKKQTNRQIDIEQKKGKKAFRLREQQEKEAKEEIKKFKIPTYDNQTE